MVHRKRLFTGQILYFRHAPPFTNLDTASDSRRLSPPYPRAPNYECSMYYYWWAAMRLNDDYLACCESGGEGAMATLFADFGDVRGDSFMDWWIDGGRLLFCEPIEDAATILREAPHDHDSEKRVLISVPVDGDLDRITAEIRTAMGEYRQKHYTAEMRDSRARYQIMATAKLQSLYRQLYVYKAKKEGLGHKTIAHNLGIGTSDRSYNENATVSAVSRYYVEAQKLITNVGKGRFPDYSEPAEEPNLFG